MINLLKFINKSYLVLSFRSFDSFASFFDMFVFNTFNLFQQLPSCCKEAFNVAR